MASTYTKRKNKAKEKLKFKSSSFAKASEDKQKSKVQVKSKKSEKLVTGLIIFGIVLISSGLLIFILTFFPIFKEEVKYTFRNTNSTKSRLIQPINTDFGIVIPKILANAKVVDNVDPYNSQAYQIALTHGVAHAQGTAYPGHAGNIFIFAHSSSNWFTANRYNSVFYLIDKLEKGDEVDLYYKGKKYVYQVFEKKIVEASAVSYLTGRLKPTPTEDTSILTLMTCWPPGTTLKRLIIQAKIIN